MKEIFLELANENLKAAELLFDNNFFNASANRAYYSAFHIAIAAIYTLGITPAMDHRTVQTLFTEHYCNRRKVLPSKYKGFLPEMQHQRNNADYKNGVQKKTANKQLKDAKEFFELISEIIK
jgi:uncharacterized protein (UPF0332 family)